MNYTPFTLSFAKEMNSQLESNQAKYPGIKWRDLSEKELVNETYYHVGKLQHAVKEQDKPRIKEFAADIGNCAMMVLDKFGILPEYKAELPSTKHIIATYLTTDPGNPYYYLGYYISINKQLKPALTANVNNALKLDTEEEAKPIAYGLNMINNIFKIEKHEY